MKPIYLIDIRHEAPRYKLSSAKIQKAAAAILFALGWKKASVNLWLVTDRKMRSLNKKFMGHDRATDVISFSQREGKQLRVGETLKTAAVPLGDLIISLDTTARQAKEYGNTFWYEFCFYLCHGVLHLMGWDDQSPKNAAKMERKQIIILKKIGINNNVQRRAYSGQRKSKT